MSEKQDVITIKIGDRFRDVKVPRSWDDLDAKTALLFYSTLFTSTGDEFTHSAFTAVKLISLTQHILGFSPDMMAKWEADALRADAEHGQAVFLDELKQVIEAAMAGLFEVVTDEASGNTGYAVRFNRTRNPWPVLMHTPPAGRGAKRPAKTRTLYCAKDGLENITVYELAYTFSMYEAYVQTRDEMFALRLIGALYRPSRPETEEERESAWHGDRRQPLRRYEGKVEERAKMAATLPMLTRRFLVFWFAGCREAIVKRYPRVFKKAGDGDGGGGGDWGRMLLSLAESNTFGSLGETSDQHYSNALEYMSMKDEQAEDMRKEFEKSKRKR